MKKLFAILLILSVVAQADTKTLGEANIIDAQLRQVGPNNNFGANGGIVVQNTNTTHSYTTILSFINLKDSIGTGKTLQPCTLKYYCTTLGTAGPVSASLLFKPVLEGDNTNAVADANECSWYDWAATDSEFTTAGALSLSDAGTFNTGDGTGADAKATPFDTTDITAITAWYSWVIPATDMQSIYDGQRGGILLRGIVIDTVNATFSSAENSTAANRPDLVVVYSTAETGTVSSRRRRLILE